MTSKQQFELAALVIMLGSSVSANAFVSYDTGKDITALEARLSALENKTGNQVHPSGYQPPEPQSIPTLDQLATQSLSSPVALPQEQCLSGYIERGNRPSSVKEVRYKGNGSIVKAAKQMVPKGWHVSVKDLSREPTIWDMKEAWYFVLGVTARDAGACATIDWTDRSVLITKNTASIINPRAATSLQNESIDNQYKLKDDQSLANPLDMAPTEKLDGQTNFWMLESGKTLKENLALWSEKAGWKMVWKVQNMDFRVNTGATLTGDFMSALEQVMLAYEDGSNPIAVNVYEANHVIEVIDHIPFKRNAIAE